MKSPQIKDLELLPHKFQVEFAIFCAKQVEHLWKHIPEAVKAIETASLFLDGLATAEECRVAAAYAAAYAAANAAANAAYAAAYATYAANAANAAAANAAYAANATELITAQWEYYNNLLHFDSICEQILLVGE